MKEKILVIDDDELLLKSISARLSEASYQVTTARNGLEGLKRAYDIHPDLIILDVKMPGLDGHEVTQRVLELANIPIIMLTGLSSSPDIVKGLSIGADDYITKPFNMDELLARVQLSLRRKASPGSLPSAVIDLGNNVLVDLTRRRVTVSGKLVKLTPTEFHLLSYLARNRGRVVPHRTLLVEIWGQEYSNEIEYLHLYVRYLRRKIERDPSHPEILKTERGVGYYVD